MKAPRLALALLSLAALAACVDGLTPTGAAPARPANNSAGFGIGGANVVPTDTTDASTTTSTTATAPDSVEAGRGGFGMGGGN
jgi:hypothetical protein